MTNDDNHKAVVLAVDDDPDNLRLLKIALGKEGYRILTSLNGFEAIELARERTPDIIFLDIMMPEIDGYETCRRLKALPETRDIPVLFLTALSDVEQLSRGFEVGAVDYIVKPFRLKETVARLENHLQLKRLRDNLEAVVEERTAALKNEIEVRKGIEIELREAKARAESINRLKSAFLANLSHELRTPINGVVGSINAAMTNIEDEATRELLQDSTRSARRLMQTLNSLLDLSLLEAREVQPSLAPYRAAELARQAVEARRADAHAKGLTIDVVEKVERVIAQVDERHMLQTLLNVLDNAIKFTEEGGTTVVIDFDEETSKAIIRVADTGIGISDEQLQLLFEDFRQGDEGPTKRFEGTGVGLTVAAKLVGIMNGTIDVEPREGGGTVFTLRFPGERLDEQAESNAARAAIANPDALPDAETLSELVVLANSGDRGELQKRVDRLVETDGPTAFAELVRKYADEYELEKAAALARAALSSKR
jgi:two-component system, sensor histidine kinase and response regulator